MMSAAIDAKQTIIIVILLVNFLMMVNLTLWASRKLEVTPRDVYQRLELVEDIEDHIKDIYQRLEIIDDHIDNKKG